MEKPQVSKSISLRKRLFDPAIHRYTKFGRTIIRSKDGSKNITWILAAANKMLTYPLNETQEAKYTDKTSLYKAIHVQLFVFALGEDARYYLKIFKTNTIQHALILVDDNPSSDQDFSSVGILLPTVRLKMIDARIVSEYTLEGFKALLRKFRIHAENIKNFALIKQTNPLPQQNESKTSRKISRLIRGAKRAIKQHVLGVSASMSRQKTHRVAQQTQNVAQQTHQRLVTYDEIFGCMVNSKDAKENKNLIWLAAQGNLKPSLDNVTGKEWLYTRLALKKHIFIMAHSNTVKVRKVEGVYSINEALVLVDRNAQNDADFSSLIILQTSDSENCNDHLQYIFSVSEFEKLLQRLSVTYSFRGEHISFDALEIDSTCQLRTNPNSDYGNL